MPSESREMRSDHLGGAKIISEFGAEFVGYRGSHHYQASGCWSVMSVTSLDATKRWYRSTETSESPFPVDGRRALFDV
ncbi:hypothetical protein LNA02_14110 [Levilactobacillus namurensis]|nr:hypothetical protein LNA02_14110 [Levilactobacillus namurensis]